MTDQEALAGASQLARNAVNAARFFDPSLWILTPPTGWLNRIDEVLRYHGAADRDGSPLGVALGNLIKSWYKDPAEEAPGPVHWGPRGEPVVDGELKDRFAAAYEKLDPHNDDNFYRQTGEAAFAVVAPVLAERDREAEQVRIRLADALEMTYSLTVAELIDAVSEYVTEFQNLARRKAKAAETYRLDADTHRQQIERLTRERDEAQAAIRDIDAHATPIGLLHEDDPDGSPHHYLVSVGALHRALGKSNGTGVKCDVERNLLRWLHAEAMWQLGEAGEVVGQQRAELDEHRFKLNDALGIVGAEEDIDPYEAVVGLHREIDRLRAERDEAREYVADLALEANRSWTGWDGEVPAAVEEARQEIERLRKANEVMANALQGSAYDTKDVLQLQADLDEARGRLDAFKAGVRLFWLPEFGDDEEIKLDEPVVHNRADGRFVLRPTAGRPDTEATEPVEPVWKIEVEVPAKAAEQVELHSLFNAVADAVHAWEPADRDGWDVSVSSGLWALPEWERNLLAAEETPKTFAEKLPHAAVAEAQRLSEPAPREPRVWRKGDPEPVDVAQVRDTDGDIWERRFVDGDLRVWMCSPDDPSWVWRILVERYGPLAEVVEDGAVGTPDAETGSGP